MTKEIGFMGFQLVVSPDVVLAVSASIEIIVWIASVLLHIIDILAHCYANAGNGFSTIIADEYIAVLNALFRDYLAHIRMAMGLRLGRPAE